jgi:hypothetical protein
VETAKEPIFIYIYIYIYMYMYIYIYIYIYIARPPTYFLSAPIYSCTTFVGQLEPAWAAAK